MEACLGPLYRNVDSFIVTDNCDDAIVLPTSCGLIGIAQEEGLLIMESYDYYKGGGRYSRIEAFDLEGNKLDSMAPKLNPLHDDPIYYDLLFPDKD